MLGTHARDPAGSDPETSYTVAAMTDSLNTKHLQKMPAPPGVARRKDIIAGCFAQFYCWFILLRNTFFQKYALLFSLKL